MSEQKGKAFVIREIIQMGSTMTADELACYTFTKLCKLRETLKNLPPPQAEENDMGPPPWSCEYRDNN